MADGGSAQTVAAFPTLRQVWDRDKMQLSFFFVPIKTTFTDASGTYNATFWVTSDAVKYKIPASEALLLAEWNKHKHPDPIDPDGDMLVRLPCTARQNQALANVLTTHPDPIKSGAEDGMINHTAPIRPEMKPEPCLLLTPYLYSRRYQQMTAKIAPVGRDTNLPIVQESAKHNQYLNQKIEAFMKARGDSLRVPSLGDPGKIWAITNGVYEDKIGTFTKKDGSTGSYPYKAAVNYGWHGGTAALQSVIPGLLCLQSIGQRHDDGHFDYSQVCVLVGGWCELTEPGDTGPRWIETREIYVTQKWCKLATHDGIPIKLLKYNT